MVPRFLILLLFICFFTGPLVSKQKKITFYFVNTGETAQIKKSIKKVRRFLEKETGLKIKTVLAAPGRYSQIIDAMGKGKADIAFINTFGYLLARQRHGVRPLLLVVRGDNLTRYRGQLVVRADAQIKELADLRGKNVAFMNKLSASGYLLPSQMLASAGVKVRAQHHGSWRAVLMAVLKKKATAGATYYLPADGNGDIQDARKILKLEFPEIEKKLVVLKLTPELSNEPIMVRKGLDNKTAKLLARALKKYIARAKGRRVLMGMYSINWFEDTKDAHFDATRKFLKQANIDLNTLIR